MRQILNYFTSNTPISSKNLLVKFFKRYVQPRYLYGIIIYGTTKKSILTKLKRQQNFFLRIVFHLKKSDEVRTTIKKHAKNHLRNSVTFKSYDSDIERNLILRGPNQPKSFQFCLCSLL